MAQQDPQSMNQAHAASMRLLQQAVALHRQGQLAQAGALYRQILQRQPGHFDALHLLGVVAQQSGDPQAAIESISQAIRIKPGNADAHSNLGNALRDLKRHEEALASYERALGIRPDYVEPLYNRGLALQELRRNQEALASYDRALALRPDYAQALYNRGVALQDLKRYADAAASFARLLGIAPDYPYAAGKLCYARLQYCDWTHYRSDTESVVSAARAGWQACDPFSFAAISHDAATQLECARTYAGDKYPAAAKPLWTGQRYAHDRIRIAYLSADFHDHATAYLMAGLFEQHDRARFEVTALSFGPAAQGGMRARLQPAFDRFVEVGGMSDRAAAMLLREWEIDIAIDLKGYTQDNRTGILAQRAAPIQVNYLGHPGTMGADYFDYILADATLIPEQQRANYSEQVVYLPDCYQANDDARAISAHTPTRAEAGLPEEGFVFCCFNNNYKITPEVFAIWMRLLQQVPGSVLWLLEDTPAASANLRREAVSREIAPARLVFAPRMELDRHLARHRLADLFLDTLPYTAHTTASDALWAGLPLLTCSGETFAARVAASLLGAIGLPELVTGNLAEYEALALRLATTPQLLAGIRARLASNRSTRPLFQTDRFRRHLESAYVTMWERRQREELPASFTVPPSSPTRQDAAMQEPHRSK